MGSSSATGDEARGPIPSSTAVVGIPTFLHFVPIEPSESTSSLNSSKICWMFEPKGWKDIDSMEVAVPRAAPVKSKEATFKGYMATGSFD